MTLEELGATLVAVDAAMLSLAPVKGGGWQASFRTRGGDGWLIYVTKDGETIVDAVAGVLPKPKDNGARAAQDGLFD